MSLPTSATSLIAIRKVLVVILCCWIVRMNFIAGVGFDFPINKHFQPIAEVRSTQYVGGRTPNAFENNPVDCLAGVKIYPRRWFGFGFAYRRHLNQQDQDHFNPATSIFRSNNYQRQRSWSGLVVVPGFTVLRPLMVFRMASGSLKSRMALSLSSGLVTGMQRTVRRRRM